MAVSGYIALMLAIVASRIINERGYRILSAEEKLRLMDGFSSARAYSLIPLVILICVFAFLLTQTALDKSIVTGGYFTVLVVYVVLRSVWSHRKMKSLLMPATYRRYFTISQLLALLGTAWFFFTILSDQRTA